MAFPVPVSLSPSRVESFTRCPLTFRFSSLEKLPEPPSPHATKGSLVHRALELLFMRSPAERTPTAALDDLDRAVTEFSARGELGNLFTDPAQEQALIDDAERLVRRYFEMEDPSAIREIGLELRLSVDVAGLTLRGVIDRLELDDDGALVVTDYKTGRSPSPQHEMGRLGGVLFYAYLCEQLFGQRPSKVQLLYLATGEVITLRPSEQQVRFLPRRTTAVFAAVEKACATGDFRPRPSALCGSCAFQTWCPAFGGDPERARHEIHGTLAVVA